MESSIKNTNLFQAWLVLLLATVFGTTLAGVQTKLGPVIEANKINETMEKIPTLTLGEAQAEKMTEQGNALVIEPRLIEISKNGIKKFYTVYDAYYKDGTRAGFVAKASGQGYADKIELLLGLDADASTITGLFILDQKETPGLGNKVIEKHWRDQFLNQSSDKGLVVVKGKSEGSHEIGAVSGATISSKSVTGIVNRTIADIKHQLILPPVSENDKIKENK
ncbi:FMN-binding protein [Desulfonema magnum]|uniref:Ion-translocating oxidoreductase complex subunit G n=1 Tax=Desulfonema magnum TaxID=45655 RepID=A0A975BJE6_9BACT|nr:FMN-binding protein [Desulfonema magnum]QTA86662.1 Ion-translocating oxidoreductase complex, subunit G [Desulfonema magnum]